MGGNVKQSVLAVVGGGPKALAIAAKASVLAKLGFRPPKIVILEKSEIAHHWVEGSSFTNGRLPLGTSADKDIGFPYYSFCWGDSANKRVNYLMQRYSWQNFLIAKHRFADWIDRGRPAPYHHEWAEYLRWVYGHLASQVELVHAKVQSVDIAADRWKISSVTPNGETIQTDADGLVFTGPGEMKLPFEVPSHERILTYSDFWKKHRQLGAVRNATFALVGAGENAATIAVTLGQADPSISIHIISPNATSYTRGESYVENHLYTDPIQGNWLQLTQEDRRDFIQRTDRGVFSVTTKRQLDHLRNIESTPGMLKGVRVDKLDQIALNLEYNKGSEEQIFDYLILAVGFNHTYFVERLLTPRAKERLMDSAHLREWTTAELEQKVDENLALEGQLQPVLHLPMLAGMNQGPGFANLSCLGRLSDHILARYVVIGSSERMREPLLLSLTDTEMNMDDPTS